mmetsp:Transcript_913/g.2113  ORF Transcript_913/g.2113 Transcript_913/m.2113 type:complete len:99 (-) Transcript_913:215-511(-)|eukprot:CAMPEP_0178504396 /NCGR_PEP_ID=MMETSP0696-20121128/18569_1 /TAXON_ID=265572 /ORGANISM="Extubocellulus spinifer, Strain CCMP396" /LENGTH=98 /DNA_ID=CAMNT_0020133625 /DNA_START=315 /DNA_END=611 /DNA_ORIENTATION=+
MVHIPSLLVGSAVSGVGFLIIDRELSHRKRLSRRWAISEYAEEQFYELRAKAKEAAAASTSHAEKSITPDIASLSGNATAAWNKGVGSMRDLVGKSDK